jgi:RecA-family ATPase
VPADRVAIYDAEGLRLSDAEDRAWMLATIKTEGANLVVIDALRPLAPDAEENNSDAMAPVVIGAKQLARDSGAAVVLIHHRGNDRMRDFRGSTATRDQTVLLFVLERDERDPERKWRRKLRCAKCRIA